MTTKKLSRNVSRGLITRTALTIFSAMLLLQLPACVEELTPPNNDNETTITFSVGVPRNFTPSTYGFEKEDEEYLDTVDVLLFDNSGNYVSGPHYGIINGSNVTVRIPDTDGTYTMAVFGNCRSKLNDDFSGLGKEDVYEGIIIENDVAWDTTVNTGIPAKPIPMWGEASVEVENETVTSGTVTVNLLRMLARINVTNNADNFTLSSVRVYNYNKNGRVAPVTDYVTTLVSEGTTTVTVTDTSLPSGDNRILGPLEYSVADGTKGKGLNNEIYVFEANKGADDTPANNPCLVIGGSYNDGSTSYYRIDFVDVDYLNLLRNYTYEINISKIGGVGYDSYDAAFASRPVNIEYNIAAWGDSGITDIVHNGQYSLGVSQSRISFSRAAAKAMLTVNTDYASGWTAKVLDADQATDQTENLGFWLQIDPKSNSVAGRKDITLSAAANGDPAPRTAYLQITSGTLVYTIRVTQSNVGDVSLLIDDFITDKTLTFVSHVDNAIFSPQSFTLKWEPVASTIDYVSTGDTGSFTFDDAPISASGQLTSADGGGNGTKTIEVKSPAFFGGTPTSLVPLADCAEAKVSYILSGVSRSVILKQHVWDAFLENSSGSSIVSGSLYFVADKDIIPAAQTINLYAPVGSTVSWSGNTNFDITGNATTTSVSTSYSVRPKEAMTTPIKYSNTVTCTVTYEGENISKTFTLNQALAIPITLHAAKVYPVASRGISHRFYVLEDIPIDWEITDVVASDGISVLDNMIGIAGNPNEEKAVEFKTNGSVTEGSVTVIFTDPDGNYGDTPKILIFGSEYKPAMHRGWAGSNIYFDESIGENGAMTFATIDDANIETVKKYQGLFFRWGSLFGASCSGNTTITVYLPTGGSQSMDWSSVSYIGITSNDSDSDNMHSLYYSGNGTTTGDICRVLSAQGDSEGVSSGNWRMPTAAEYVELYGVGEDARWTIDGTEGGGGVETGQGIITKGLNISTLSVWLPASGRRSNSVAGGFVSVGSIGRYRSASPSSNFPYDLNFDISPDVVTTAVTRHGMSIRCVRE